MRLGAVTGAALDGGGSTTMAFDGTLLNRPSDPAGERPIAESLSLFYYGVYAPELPRRRPLAERRRRGRAADARVQARPAVDGEREADRAGRLASARSTPARRRRSARTARSGRRRAAPEGRLALRRRRDRRPRSHVDRRALVLRQQHARLARGPGARRGGTLRGAFTLSRTSQVRGTVLDRVGRGRCGRSPARSLPAGAQAITWNDAERVRFAVRAGTLSASRDGARTRSASVSLTAPFTISAASARPPPSPR